MLTCWNNKKELPQKKKLSKIITKHYNDIRDLKLQYDNIRNKIQSNI